MNFRNTILDPICLLMKGPRTAHEMIELLDAKQRVVSRWLSRLRASGLVYVCAVRGRQHVYAWQPTPFAFDDCQGARRKKGLKP